MIKTEAYNDCQQFLALTKKNGVKAGKLYVKKPLNVASAFNVTRNLAAYRLNQEGLLELMGVDVPRIDYTNGCPELLIENEAINYCTHSNNPSDASYVSSDVTITANYGVAPDGNTVSNRLQFTGGVNSFIYKIVNVGGVGLTTIYSVYLRSASATTIRLVDAYSGIGNTLNITTEWVRYFLPLTSNGSGNIVFQLDNYTGGLGQPARDIEYAFGQVEISYSGRATSYIPTTTVAVTRPADIIENSTFGYNNDTSTIFIRARLEFSESIQGLVTLGDGGVLDDYMSLWIVESGGDKFLAIDTYTNPDQNTIYVTLPNDGVYSIALGYNLLTAEYSLAVNGVIESTGTFVNTLPTSTPLTTMQLGRIGSNYDARIIGFMYFDSKLDDTSLENLTTV